MVLLLQYYNIGMLLIAMTYLRLNHLPVCITLVCTDEPLFFFRIKGHPTALQKLIKSISINKAFVPTAPGVLEPLQ